MRGRRVGSPPLFQSARFHRAWKSFQASWKAMKVLPVPVARVSQQDAILSRRDGFEDAPDGDILIVARLPLAALVLEGDGGEAVAPGVLLGEDDIPEFIRRRISGNILLRAGCHIDLIDADTIGGVGEAGLQLAGILLGLPDALGIRQIPPLGLDHGQLVIAVGQHVVGNVLFRPLAGPLQPSKGDDLAPHPACFHDAPACRPQGRVNQLGASFSLVHSAASCTASKDRAVSSPANAFCSIACLSAENRSSFRWLKSARRSTSTEIVSI